MSRRVAMCVPTLNRSERLERLLDSARWVGALDRVVVADNGQQSAEKDALYERDWPFEFDVLDLEYDIGVGTCFDEALSLVHDDVDYLLAAADDHALSASKVGGVSKTVDTLLKQLQADETLGGIGANIIEPDEGRVWQSAKDFTEHGDSLVRSAGFDKEVEFAGGYPVVEFDFIPYPTLFRIEALEDYSWDAEYPLGRTHADLYVGHWKRTDWRFGINPACAFYHYPGGDEAYEEHRHDEEKLRRAQTYFHEKWGYDQLYGDANHRYWFDTA